MQKQKIDSSPGCRPEVQAGEEGTAEGKDRTEGQRAKGWRRGGYSGGSLSGAVDGGWEEQEGPGSLPGSGRLGQVQEWV